MAGCRAAAIALSVALALCSLARSAPLVRSLVPRSGVVMVGEQDGPTLGQLGQVAYYRYGFGGEDAAGHHRFLMVRPRFDPDALAAAMRARPGAWWLVGNEPNDPNQDNLTPAAYAGFYRRVERVARLADPSARLLPAGVANADWAWCEAFCKAYADQYGAWPDVAGWSVHNYVLEPEHDQLDVVIFQERIVAFRDWMDVTGYGDSALLLTEFGALYQMPERRPGSEDDLEGYIAQTVVWLETTDVVNMWFWFATETGGEFGGDLYDGAGRLTRAGEAYRLATQE